MAVYYTSSGDKVHIGGSDEWAASEAAKYGWTSINPNAPISSSSPILQPQQFDIDAFMSQITNQMNQQLSSFQQQLLNNQSVLSDSLTQNQLNLGNMFKVGTTQNQFNLNANNRFRSGLNGASITPSPKQQAVSRYMANDIWKDKIRGDVNG